MSNESREKREKLKEEYKAHYRKMREAREEFKRTQKKKNIVDALKDMNSSELMDSFDSFLFEIKSKVATAEARLDMALGDLDPEEAGTSRQADQDRTEEFNKMKAKETLKQLKTEMGLLYSELERQAEAIDVKKTIGKSSAEPSDSPPKNES